MDDRRVLIVDDDPDVCRLVSRLLEQDGYEPLTASDGIEAMRMVLELSPPLVLTDWCMPNMNGVDLCAALRKHEGVGFLYIVILTGATEPGAIRSAMEAGADDFLYKPVKKEELLLRLRSGFRMAALQADLTRRHREAHLQFARLAVTREKLEEANATLKRMATTDELTGLTNRREAVRFLDEAWARATRHDRPLSCILADIDHFKSVNDVYGHAAGDRVLQEVAKSLADATRTEERVCRVGGEEFLVICADADAKGAAVAAERLRKAVEATQVAFGDTTLNVTLSLGVAQRGVSTPNPDVLLQAADAALYEAKRRGRNRVVRADEPAHVPAPGGALDASPTEAVVDTLSSMTNVLLVDAKEDSSGVEKLLSDVPGHQVSVVRSCRDAEDRLARLSFEVVVLCCDGSEAETLTWIESRRWAGDACRPELMLVVGDALDAGGILQAVDAGVGAIMRRPLAPADFLRRFKELAEAGLTRKALSHSNAVRAEQARAFELMLEFSRDVVSATTLPQLLDRTIQAVAQLTRSRRVSIMLPETDRRYLTIARALGLDRAIVDTVRQPIGRGVAGRVFSEARPIVQSGAGSEPPPGERYLSGSFVSMPLILLHDDGTECVVGVLNVTDHVSRGGLPFFELECLDMVGNIAASAISVMLTRQSRDRAHDSVVFALARLAEHRDNDTGRHLERVTRYSTLLAERLRRMPSFANMIDDAFIRNLERVVPLHDVGKVAIPDHILLKPGALDEHELAVMRTHVEIGTSTIQSVLSRTPGVDFLEMAVEVTSGHHEWYDGNGYPRGLRADEIPLSARIVALADVYDALTTKRTYKPAFSHQKAFGIIRDASGTQFDPAVVDAFCQCHEEFARLAVSLADRTPEAKRRGPAVTGAVSAPIETPA